MLCGGCWTTGQEAARPAKAVPPHTPYEQLADQMHHCILGSGNYKARRRAGADEVQTSCEVGGACDDCLTDPTCNEPRGTRSPGDGYFTLECSNGQCTCGVGEYIDGGDIEHEENLTFSTHLPCGNVDDARQLIPRYCGIQLNEYANAEEGSTPDVRQR